MKGYVAQRRGRFYAVIYEGLDPVTGKERRSWHPAGTDRADAERLAARLATAETQRVDRVRSLTFGAYLISQWLPAKKLHLAACNGGRASGIFGKLTCSKCNNTGVVCNTPGDHWK